MKILQLTNKLPFPPNDGGAVAMLNLAAGLADSGHQITTLAFNTNKHYFNINQIPEPIKSKIRFFEIPVNTDIHLSKAIINLLFSRLPYIATRYLSKNYCNALIDLLKDEKFDVAQIEGLYMCLYIPVIKKYSDAVIVFRSHNLEYEIWDRSTKYEKSTLKKWYFRILTKRIKRLELKILNQYNLLVPITRRDADHYLRLGCKVPLQVIQVGLDLNNYNYSEIRPEIFSLFYIGALDWMPNQEGLKWFIEEIWDSINSNHPELPFYIAGRNAPSSLLPVFNKKNIHFLGEVEDAKAFIKSKGIMVVPLFSGSGMRVKIIEGMALTKTIITTTLGAEGIDVTNGKNIIIADNKNDFIYQIDYLLNNQNACDQIGKNARLLISENYDIRKITKSLIAFYLKYIKWF